LRIIKGEIDMILYLEFIGMVLTMTGAFLITTKKLRFWGFTAFISANYIMFAFASMKGLVPLQIQMIIFFFVTIPALKAYSQNWKKVKKNLILTSIIYIILMVKFLEYKVSITSIPTIEIMAALTAITGSFLQKYKKKEIRIISFSLFFIADVLYVAISIELGMLFFGIQSLFFWYTSAKGIKNELGKETFTNYVKRNLNIKRKKYEIGF
jgi:hypothetical protein